MANGYDALGLGILSAGQSIADAILSRKKASANEDFQTTLDILDRIRSGGVSDPLVQEYIKNQDLVLPDSISDIEAMRTIESDILKKHPVVSQQARGLLQAPRLSVEQQQRAVMSIETLAPQLLNMGASQEEVGALVEIARKGEYEMAAELAKDLYSGTIKNRLGSFSTELGKTKAQLTPEARALRQEEAELDIETTAIKTEIQEGIRHEYDVKMEAIRNSYAQARESRQDLKEWLKSQNANFKGLGSGMIKAIDKSQEGFDASLKEYRALEDKLINKTSGIDWTEERIGGRTSGDPITKGQIALMYEGIADRATNTGQSIDPINEIANNLVTGGEAELSEGLVSSIRNTVEEYVSGKSTVGGVSRIDPNTKTTIKQMYDVSKKLEAYKVAKEQSIQEATTYKKNLDSTLTNPEDVPMETLLTYQSISNEIDQALKFSKVPDPNIAANSFVGRRGESIIGEDTGGFVEKNVLDPIKQIQSQEKRDPLFNVIEGVIGSVSKGGESVKKKVGELTGKTERDAIAELTVKEHIKAISSKRKPQSVTERVKKAREASKALDGSDLTQEQINEIVEAVKAHNKKLGVSQ